MTMTKWKKVFAITTTVVILFTLAGCASSTGEQTVQETLSKTTYTADENIAIVPETDYATSAPTENKVPETTEQSLPMQETEPEDSTKETEYVDSVVLVENSELRAAIAKHANTFSLDTAVREDGTVIFGDSVIEGWTDVASVGEADFDYREAPLALRWDGTVLTGDNNPTVAAWRNIIAVYQTYERNQNGKWVLQIVGLCLDGTVVSTNPDSVYDSWTNVETIQILEDRPGLIGITKDGKVLSQYNYFDFGSWTDIVQIEFGRDYDFVVGLRRDGTVLYADSNGTRVMDGWTDVVSVACALDVIALRSDGTILSNAKDIMGEDLDFSDWKNVVSIDAWGLSYIGLKADGTVLAEGTGEAGEYRLIDWNNIAAVKMGTYATVALTKDGRVLLSYVHEVKVLFSDIKIYTAPYGYETEHLFEGVKVHAVPKPSVDDVKPFGEVITYPDPGTYLDSYETKYVKAPKGNSIYVFWNYNGGVSNSRRKFNLYEGDEVTVLARQGTRSCVIFKDKTGTEQIGWVNSDYLVSEY